MGCTLGNTTDKDYLLNGVEEMRKGPETGKKNKKASVAGVGVSDKK